MKNKFSKLLIGVMLIIDAVYIMEAIKASEFSRLPTYLALPLVLLVPLFYERLFNKKLSTNLKVIFYVFVFIADFLGCVVSLYNTTEWFDVFAHFLSGILTAFLAIILMKNFKYKENKLGSLIYMLSFTCLVAIGWEIFEYGMDVFTGSNLQHALDTGVHDTMEDVIAAFIGSVSYYLFYLATLQNIKVQNFIKEIKL